MSGGRSPKRAGDQFERDVVRYFVSAGYPYAERAYGAGRRDDRGDIDGIPGWIFQCRAERTLDVASALKAATEQCPDHLHFAAAILKRKNHPVGRAYVVMELETFATIAGDLAPHHQLAKEDRS